MAFNNYLEDENDKPYFTKNSLAYYYDKMEGFAKAVEGSAKALNLTKEEVEKRITLYIEQNKNELDQRLAQWDGKLETFDSSVETLLAEWVDDGTLTHVIDTSLIDQKIAPVTAKLDETEIKTDWVDPFLFGAKGDGIADDTNALQAAIDAARALNKPFRVQGDGYTFNISRPLYLQNRTSLDFGFSFIKKTTNTLGVGANKGSVGIEYTYAVDAFFIVKIPEGYTCEDLTLKNVRFTRDKAKTTIVPYGVYAPRMQRCDIENLFSFEAITDYLCFGYTWCMMPTLKNIRQYKGKYTIKLANDGSNSGGSTSLNMEHIVGADQEGVLDLYGAPYIVITNPMIDRCEGIAFKFVMCPQVTMLSPSIEINRGRFLELQGTKITITAPRVIYNYGSLVPRNFISVGAFSNMVMMNGNFDDYMGEFALADNINMTISGGGSATLINTKLPANGNNFRSFAGGGTLTVIDEDGTTYQDIGGKGTKANGLRKIYRSTPPTSGEWKKGEEIINSDATGLIEKWLCIANGTPGTWKAIPFVKNSAMGTNYWDGNGTSKRFALEHGLGVTPTTAFVQPAGQTAGQAVIDYVLLSETEVITYLKNPPPVGTNNVALRWKAEL